MATPSASEPGRGWTVAFCVLLSLVAVLLLRIPPQILTGDEARYLLYAVSVIRHGRIGMTPAEWLALRDAVGSGPDALPLGGNGVLVMNGVYLPALLSPVAGLARLAGLRAVSLLAGLFGLVHLLRLARLAAPMPAAFCAASLAASCIPLLPYLHLFYMESVLFGLVCFGWHRLQRERSAAGDLLTAIVLLLVPVAHMRGAGVAAVLFAILLARSWRRGRRRRAVLLFGLGAAAALLFLGLNLALYGAVTGPVNTARPPPPWRWFSVLSMQLFNVHHGLFAYAPLWLLGYAGLLAGLGRRAPPVLRQALLLALVAGLTGVGVNPGECWPARFWVLSVPMLTVGLAHWLGRMRGVAMPAAFVLLLLATLLNSLLFLSHPNMFLLNRQSSVTYDALWFRFGVANPGLFLPVEFGDGADAPLADALGLAALLFVASAAVAVRFRHACWPALLLLLAAFDLSRVASLPPPESVLERGVMRIAFDRPPPRVAVLELGHREQVWFAGPVWPTLDLRAEGVSGAADRVVPANQRLSVSCDGGVRALWIVPHGLVLPPPDLYPPALFASRSLLRAILPAAPC